MRLPAPPRPLFDSKSDNRYCTQVDVDSNSEPHRETSAAAGEASASRGFGVVDQLRRVEDPNGGDLPSILPCTVGYRAIRGTDSPPRDSEATAMNPPSWGDIVEREEQEQAAAAHVATPRCCPAAGPSVDDRGTSELPAARADVRFLLQDLDVVHAVWLNSLPWSSSVHRGHPRQRVPDRP